MRTSKRMSEMTNRVRTRTQELNRISTGDEDEEDEDVRDAEEDER